MKRVVLAYSGGLDTSVAIAWLREQGYEVIAVAIDVGQTGDLDAAVARARDLGAIEARSIDGRKEFVEQFVVPTVQMNALYQGRYPLVSALSRPLISKLLVDVAKETGADAIAHGCTGKGNDQVRFEVSIGVLAPDVEVLAPVRDWGMSRPQTIDYAASRGLPIETTKSSPYSIDENLWGRSIECGVLEDPWTAPPEEIYELTATIDPGATPVELEIGFEAGVPVSIDGEQVDVANIVASLTKIVGSYGFGRIDMVEDRLVGIKSREIYEAPAALALIAAHADLESMTLERRLASEKRKLDQLWADLVYEGLWYSPLKEALDSFCATTQEHVSGDVRLRVGPGWCTPVGRRSSVALYDHSLATYDQGDLFDHSDAQGFIHLWGLSARRWAQVHRD